MKFDRVWRGPFFAQPESPWNRTRPPKFQFAALRETLVRAPLQPVGVARSTVGNHERAQPARGFPVRRSSAARVCLRSCPAGALTRAKPGTGPPSRVSGGQGWRPFRYPRARLTRLGAPKSPLQSTRPVMRRSSGARGRHTKMAATRRVLAGLALSRSWGKARQQDRVARLPAHVARLHHGREARPPRPVGFFPRRPDPRAVASSIAALGGPPWA